MEVKQLLAFVLILLNHVYQVSAVCNAPNGFENAKVVRGLLEQQGVYEEGVELEYECNNGFRLTTGYASRCRNGQWTEIRCDRISCKWLPAPDHGKRLDSNSYMGNTTQFACNEGYRLIGYEYLLCRADGYWRPSQPPVCQPVNCGSLPTPVNGNAFQATRNGNVNIYGHVVKFSCEFGYDLIKGSKERRCQADGTWSGTQPVCEEPSCPDFDPVYNGQVYYNNDEKNAIFDVAEIECNEGSDVFPENTQYVRCIDRNTWDINNITCERHLKIPPPSNMKLYTGQGRHRSRITSSTRFKSRTWLDVECEYKHELFNGQTKKYYDVKQVLVQIFNGTMTPELPICRKERCNLEAKDCSYMDTNGNKLVGKVDHDTVVVKKCDPNFEFKPSNIRNELSQTSTCNRGVIYFPRCIPKRCEIPADRRAKLSGRYNYFNAGDLIDNEEMVKITCEARKELYYPETQTYEENSKIFTSTCRTGVWSNNIFPICKEKRCTSPSDKDGTRFLLNGKNIITGTKLEHGTILTKSCNQGYEDITNSSTECSSGRWIGDEPCKGKPCTLPAIEHTEENEKSKQLAHNKRAKVKCSYGYEMMNSDVEIKKIRPKCHLGNLKPSLDDIKCVPKGCSGTSNADVYRTSASGNRKGEPASSFEHEEYATVKCHDHHVLSQGSEPVRGRESAATQCLFGRWKPDYACKPDACRVDIPENGNLWIENVNKTRRGGTRMIHGHMGTISCEPNYTLYNDTIALRNDSYRITCVGNKLNTTLPKCVKSVLDAEEEATESPVDEKASTTTIILENTAKNGVPDAEEDADMDYNAFDEQIVGATETFVDERFSTTPTENNATVFATKDAAISSTTTDAPLSSTTPFSESPVTTEERCNLVADDCSYMDTDGNTLVGKVDHDTMVVKRCNPNFEFEPFNKRKEPSQTTTCNQGYINFHQCIPKRCEIPHDRHARLNDDYLEAGELVDSEITVVTDCGQGEELYYPESKTYANTFTTTCTVVGLWSDDDFPKCKEERCTSPSDSDGTRFLLNGKSVKTGTKLEHGTILTKSCNQGYEDITNSSTECFSGGWIGDEPCTGKPCTLPAIEHTKKNRMSKQLAHNKEAKVKCSNGYEMMHSDVEIQKIRPKCHLGNLKPSLDDIKCVPKGCSGTSNADVYRTSASGKIEEEPASSFEHKEFATVKCHDHHVLSEGSKPVHDRESVTTQCMLGKWEPDYACKQDACRVDIPENGYLWIENVNRKRRGTTRMIDGHMGTIYCEPNYTLYNDTIALRNDGYPIACVGNKLNATLPKCVKSVPDAEEEATESPVDKKASTTTMIPKNTAKNATVFATKDATISSTTTDAPMSSTTPFSESPVTTQDGVDYDFDYPGVNEIKSEEACPDPANGRMVNYYLYFYNVVCADGYELVVLENDVDYKCSNGSWISKNFGWEPECKELTCDITDEILAVMKVFKQVQGNEMYVSDVRDEIQPDQKYYFECKQENHEPVKRLFTCSGGNWTAAERDPNWKMQIDKMEPTCRKALCDPACQFGGKCVKDGMCKCVPGTKGKSCEIPVCNTACTTNGGKCEAPNTCKCEEPRYGTNCEQVGCGRPDLPEGVSMKGTKNFFKVGDVLSSDQLTCYQGYVLSNTIRCTGNHTWYGKAECLKETRYELQVKVGSSQWAGSYGSLYVTILSAENGIIHRMAFEKPQVDGLYPGQSKTLSSSTTGQTDKVGQLKLLLGPGHYDKNDNLDIDHVRLTIQSAADNIIEDYTFSNVGWLDKDRPKLVSPDIFHLEYRLGDDSYAGSSDTLYISFNGSLGHTPWYLMSSGRRNRGKTYHKDINGVYVGQIDAVTILNDKFVRNNMHIDYIKLTVSYEDKEEEYMFRNVGWIGSRKEIKSAITADQPELPSCHDDFDFFHGWVDPKLQHTYYTSQHVKSDEECKDNCRMDNSCKVAAVSGLSGSFTCRIVYIDRKSAFQLRNSTTIHRLYKRKC